MSQKDISMFTETTLYAIAPELPERVFRLQEVYLISYLSCLFVTGNQ